MQVTPFEWVAWGRANGAKIVNNALLAAHLHLATDALALGERWDIDHDALLSILRSSTRSSRALELVAAGRTLQALARGPARATMAKDVELATDLFGPGPDGSVVDVARHWCQAMERDARKDC